MTTSVWPPISPLERYMFVSPFIRAGANGTNDEGVKIGKFLFSSTEKFCVIIIIITGNSMLHLLWKRTLLMLLKFIRAPHKSSQAMDVSADAVNVDKILRIEWPCSCTEQEPVIFVYCEATQNIRRRWRTNGGTKDNDFVFYLILNGFSLKFAATSGLVLSLGCKYQYRNIYSSSNVLESVSFHSRISLHFELSVCCSCKLPFIIVMVDKNELREHKNSMWKKYKIYFCFFEAQLKL